MPSLFTYSVILSLMVYEAQSLCQHPPLAPGYTNAAYSGVWYEAGKIQTAGGGFFQKDCFCTETTINSEFPVWGDAEVKNECRKYSVDSSNTTVFEGTLTAGDVPGNFEQRFNDALPPADYNVIWLDDDTAIEYDCTRNFGVEDYCVHFMSRTGEIDPVKLETMINYAESLGLNTRNLPFEATEQNGCR